jgi:hypothetical protein
MALTGSDERRFGGSFQLSVLRLIVSSWTQPDSDIRFMTLSDSTLVYRDMDAASSCSSGNALSGAYPVVVPNHVRVSEGFMDE